ncbi:MAG: murein biosynthesis integral membrane protein MurJ [Proteobacteria bacterium]|nr:murein biosynthesis integral membrane protein MurJ [Pseudomonadota bacterium]MBU1715211.1 murein biosynthesis integral membrane protein MurJ [Pseudomonadota bacterium]
MKKPSEDTGLIARSAGTVSIAVMCSRVLGLVREQAFAFMFGAGFAFDAFVVAFRIPNLLRDLFGEGALSAAFVAVFSDYDANKGEAATWKLASNVLVFFGILLSIITLVGIFFAEPLVRFMVDADFEAIPNKVALTRLLTMIMFPFLVLISLSSVVMGVLNTKGRFFVPAMASSFFNIGSLLGGVTLAFVLGRQGHPSIVGMAIGTLIGGGLQLVWQLPTLKKAGFSFTPGLNLADPGLRRILRLMVPALIGLAPLQVNVLVNTYFASSLAEGSLSWLNYAFRLFWLPVGLFGVAMSTAAMPVISRYAALKDMESLRDACVSALTMAFCLTIPAAAGLILLGEPIVRVIFEHGRFDAFTTIKTAEALSFYAMGLFAYSSVKIMVPVFYALDDTKYPVIGSFLAMGSNVLVIFATIHTLQHKALAFSISCAMTLNFLFLITMLYRKLNGLPLIYLFEGLGKVIIGTGAMVLWLIFLGRSSALALLQGQGIALEILSLFISIGSGAVLYGFMLHVFKLRELNVIVEKLVGRIRG